MMAAPSRQACVETPHLSVHLSQEDSRYNMRRVLIIFCVIKLINNVMSADIVKEDVQFLNELPLEKLIRLKSSLQNLVTTDFESLENVTTTPTYQNFGAQAMAAQAPPRNPIRRGDYEEGWDKGGSSKISNIFSMSVTTLAFLAFGGYLLCLIVHAIKSKQMYYNSMVPTTVQPATFFVSAGIKKKPQPQFASYGRRRRRDNREEMSLNQIELPPEELFSALMHLCEGYAKWSERHGQNETSFH